MVKIQITTLSGTVAVCGMRFTTVCSAAGGGGDPHFFRFQSTALEESRPRDSFHGECDLVLVKSLNFHNHAGFELQARTTIDTIYSYIESTALKIGNDILEVSAKQLYFNGQSVEAPVRFGDVETGYEYALIQTKTKGDKKVFVLEANSLPLVTYRIYKHYVTEAVQQWVALSANQGLMGTLSDGCMMTRDNLPFNGPFGEYAFEWQVDTLRGDSALFVDAERSPQLPFESCRMPTMSRPARRLSANNSALLRQAEDACASAVSNDHDLSLCVDDVMATGELELATMR